jgi:hypothetical protein
MLYDIVMKLNIYIDFQFCHLITDNSIIKIISNYETLQSLHITYCRNITNNCLISIAHSYRGEMLYLDLSGCYEISKTLQKTFKSIYELRIAIDAL